MSGRPLVIGLALVAVGCGDGVVRDDVVTATNGGRLAAYWYRYTDGTEQPGAEIYDRFEHTPCVPVRWTDGVVRCVPVAEPVVYLDAACAEPVGLRTEEARPTHFLATEVDDREAMVTHVFRAGPATDAPVAATYRRGDEGCFGPVATPDGAIHHQLADEVDGATLVPLFEREVGAGRLAMRVRESEDGLRLPLGLVDRELGRSCTPVATAAGVTCEPTDAAPTDRFVDPQCERPALVVTAGGPPPTLARALAPSGCATYHAVSGQTAGPVFRRIGGGCVPAPINPGARVFALAPALAPPSLVDLVDDAPGRRLQRITLSDGALQIWDEALFDTATGTTCRRMTVGDQTRCVPAVLATGSWLSTASCASDVPVVELPAQACARPAFAAVTSGLGLELRAIGDPVAETLYRADGGGCRLYVAPADHVVHALGPPLAADTFLGAIYFGAR